MERTRSRRPEQRFSNSLAGAQVPARSAHTFRPRLELLEDRVQLGDTILGLSAVALWGLGSTSLEAPLALDPGMYGRGWHNGLFYSIPAAGSRPAISLLEDSGSEGAEGTTVGDHAVIGLTTRMTAEFGSPSSLSDDGLAGQTAMYRLARPALPLTEALIGNLATTGGGSGAGWLDSGVTFSPAPLATIGESVARPVGLFAAFGAASASLPPVNLSFDASTGLLAIQAHAGEHTVREALTADGFMDVTLDGQDHSSNPRSPSFDWALAGATSATVASIHFQGAGQDTLTLGSQHLSGGLAVQATGATVATQDVATAGPLAIQAPNITVNGALQGSSIALAAAGWVNVNATGRIQAAPGASGGQIAVAAGVFVNSGQLHADGPSGGQITVQAGNILNARPVTADATSPGGSGGQVSIAFTGAYIATTAAMVSASGVAGPGGQLIIDGGSTGRLYSSGRQLATGSENGGTVNLFGRDIVLSGATVNVSGEAGGGTVRIGGDFQGRNPAVAKAETVTVTPASTITADALRTGGGGGVWVWANQTTELDGAVSARGGPIGGPGGFIEVSGQGDLSYGGTADAGARLGKSGTLLLDPKNITISDAPAGVFPQFDLIDPHPTAGGAFGNWVSVLSNGNVVVTNPNDDFGGMNAGAVYLFDGLTGALISSLVGSNPQDQVGYIMYRSGTPPVTLLANGNYLVESPFWSGKRGALTWGNGRTGVSGRISDANSLVGSNPGDEVGYAGDFMPSITPLGNGNYLVDSPSWNRQRGAVTWGNGKTGVSGIVSDSNSLVGSNPGDQVGSIGIFPSITVLGNDNYLVDSPSWNGRRGAVTWGNGSTGISGIVSDANSLVGSNRGDEVGGVQNSTSIESGILVLTNGNYVVDSTAWNGRRGAVTWEDGSRGVSGIVSDANSLVGSHAGDEVGHGYFDLSNPGVVPLINGNYVVDSPNWYAERGAATWGNGSTGISGTVSEANSLVGSRPGNGVAGGSTEEAGMLGIIPLNNGNYVIDSPGDGAVTWGNGDTGIRGTVSKANSLVGSNPYDQVGGLVIPLTNGNYVVDSEGWELFRGAVTWGNGSTGISGTISEANSLVGSSDYDEVGGSDGLAAGGVTALSNGNYVVASPVWSGGFTDGRGAVTWGNGSTGISGPVSEANSLVGSHPGDHVGSIQGAYTTPAVAALSNGNYVIPSPMWNGYRGAVTWGNGSRGISGTISDANSLVGTNPGDTVGYVAPLINGNYVVDSPDWNGFRGAVTWGNGSTGITGTVSAANSLVGSNDGDGVGYFVTPISNGNYVLDSPHWNGRRGAVTWGNGSTGVSGSVSDANSLVGSNPGDLVGAIDKYPMVGFYDDVTLLSDGNYVVGSPSWNRNRGAVTWVSGKSGQTLDGLGTITPQNSLLGSEAYVGLRNIVEDPLDQTFLAIFGTAGGGRVTAGLTDPNKLTYAAAQSQSETITPDFLTRTLDTGTAVVLEASNDITVNSPITVSAGGKGGALTLQAGRSILLNAPITTDNGPLTLIANDQLANGVVDSQRDPGNAVITMAPGSTLDTGSGPLTVELRDGAGVSNRDSGAITLQTVSAGSVAVANRGPNAGSDVNLGPVTTSGVQSFANPNGTTIVTGNLTAMANPITFSDSVVVKDGVTVNAVGSSVNFAGTGTQVLQSGNGSRFGNLLHTGIGTLRLTSGLAVTGTLLQVAGTFDANDQPVTVGQEASISGGTYLAGTAPQTFTGGLVITGGVFTSSSGAMTVHGPSAVLGGRLSGEGTVGPVTALGGTVAPGSHRPGILSVVGAVSLFSATTFSVLYNGPTPGSQYSQLSASGPITLSSSTLSLSFGFEPPVGSSFEPLTNTGAAPISGTFIGLAERAILSQGGYQFQITYQGGTGSDSVVLTRVA